MLKLLIQVTCSLCAAIIVGGAEPTTGNPASLEDVPLGVTKMCCYVGVDNTKSCFLGKVSIKDACASKNSINAIAGTHNSDNKPIIIRWRSVPTSPGVLVTQVFTMTGRVSWDQKFSPGEAEFSSGEAEFSAGEAGFSGGEAGKCFHNFLHIHMVIPLLIRALRHHSSSSLLFKAPWISKALLFKAPWISRRVQGTRTEPISY